MKSAFYLYIREKAEKVTNGGEEECDCSEKLKFTAKKPPEEDSGHQSGEYSKPFTLPTPDWKLAIHISLLSRSPHAGRRQIQKRVGGSWRRLSYIYNSNPNSLPSHKNLQKAVGNLQETCHTAGK